MHRFDEYCLDEPDLLYIFWYCFLAEHLFKHPQPCFVRPYLLHISHPKLFTELLIIRVIFGTEVLWTRKLKFPPTLS